MFTLIGYRYAPDLATFVPDSANLRVSSMRSDLILSVMAGVWMLQNELKARFGEGPDKARVEPFNGVTRVQPPIYTLFRGYIC